MAGLPKNRRRPSAASKQSDAARERAKVRSAGANVPEKNIRRQSIRTGGRATDLARHIVEQKSGSFEPGKFEDQHETVLVINEKRSGKPITPKEPPKGEKST